MTNTSDSRPALAIDGADLLSASVWAGPSYTLVRLTGEWDVTASDQLRMAERAGGTLQLASPQPVIVRLISLLGAEPLITVRTSLAEATAG